MLSPLENHIKKILDSTDQVSYQDVFCDKIYSDEEDVVKILVGYACQSQTHSYINSARKLLGEVPRKWMKYNFKSVLDNVVSYDDEWEYRRILELIQEIFPELLGWAVNIGLGSKNVEVDEAAKDFQKFL